MRRGRGEGPPSCGRRIPDGPHPCAQPPPPGGGGRGLFSDEPHPCTVLKSETLTALRPKITTTTCVWRFRHHDHQNGAEYRGKCQMVIPVFFIGFRHVISTAHPSLLATFGKLLPEASNLSAQLDRQNPAPHSVHIFNSLFLTDVSLSPRTLCPRMRAFAEKCGPSTILI